MPAVTDLCADCEPAAPLFDPQPARRLETLGQLDKKDRRFVLLAALRGGRLWHDVVSDGVDLGDALMRWLIDHGNTMLFARWIAEDAHYGAVAWAPLANAETKRTLLRAPCWLVRPNAPADELLRGWARKLLPRFSALGFRLGGCDLPDAVLDRVVDAMPIPGRPTMRASISNGRKHPTKNTWYPSPDMLAAAPRWRRWPLQLAPEGCVCCTMCGEPLGKTGACVWCGNDPEVDEPPTLLPLTELIAERALCPRCGIDQTTRATPLRCPGCGDSISYR